jgi:hypothetical protein
VTPPQNEAIMTMFQQLPTKGGKRRCQDGSQMLGNGWGVFPQPFNLVRNSFNLASGSERSA